jgi:hypothetical protein
MCRICVEYELGKLTTRDALRNAREAVQDAHGAEVLAALELIDSVQGDEEAHRKNMAALEQLAWESPAGSGEESGV